MGTSRDELLARVTALSLQKHMGMDVNEEVKKVIGMCQSEEDKQIIGNLCRALGLQVGPNQSVIPKP